MDAGLRRHDNEGPVVQLTLIMLYRVAKPPDLKAMMKSTTKSTKNTKQ